MKNENLKTMESLGEISDEQDVFFMQEALRLAEKAKAALK